MAMQLSLSFDQAPVTCPAQQRYHAIAPCLAEVRTANEQAAALNLSYRTVHRWLKQFRESGMAGLLPSACHLRDPYTPERIIVILLYFKCCVPKAADAELARVVGEATGHHLHNETVRALLERYFFWRYSEFRDRLRYPVPTGETERRLEMVKLHQQGWSEKSIACVSDATAQAAVDADLRRNCERESK